MTGTAISRCLSDTDKALRTETPQGLFLFMCAGGSSAPISPLAGFASKKAGGIFCCFKQDSQGVNLQSCFAHRARFGSSPSTMSTHKKSKPFDLLQVELVGLEPMVSLRSVSLVIVVQRRYRLLRTFSRQACASLLRPPGALQLRPLHDVNAQKKQAFRLASSGISRARTYGLASLGQPRNSRAAALSLAAHLFSAGLRLAASPTGRASAPAPPRCQRTKKASLSTCFKWD